MWLRQRAWLRRTGVYTAVGALSGTFIIFLTVCVLGVLGLAFTLLKAMIGLQAAGVVVIIIVGVIAVREIWGIVRDL
jgi:hypothetical protein